MTAEQFGGIIRTILAAGAGALVTSGYLDAATAQAIAGAVATLIVAGWSVYAKRAK